MSCVRPKRIVNPRYKGLDSESLHRLSERLFGVSFPPNYWIDVSCGNCLECQKQKFFGYRMRLLYELQRYPNSIFVTLTFDNPSLSKFKDNPNRSIRLFLDRFRKKYGNQVRHWFVAEYGSKRGRLHYHGILFDCDISNDEISDLWKYGNTFVGYANEATAKYIVKYLTKQDTKGISPPRVISSKGIGLGWIDTPEAKIVQKSLQMIFFIDGFPYSIPRYYFDKLYTDREKEIISYYYYMETPLKSVWYLDGTKYTDKRKYDYFLKRKYDYFKINGFFFDSYLKRNRISRDTRTRILFDLIGTNDFLFELKNI